VAIRFQPTKMLRKVAPRAKIERLVTKKLTVNRAAMTMLTDSNVLSKKTLEKIAIKVIRQYKEKYAEERSAGASIDEASVEAINGKKLMVQRVQNAAVHEISQEIKSQYRGEFYEWLPSDANEPDPLHQLNYGQTFQLGKGEQPGDRYGCRCGMNILVDETRLSL
jgi:hypothetical protein